MPPSNFDDPALSAQRTIAVVGLGMVGLSFIEKILEYDTDKAYRIEVFCEEPHVAYNRVGLTQYFSHRDASRLLLQTPEWYAANKVVVHLGQKATYVNHAEKWIESSSGHRVDYDNCVLATGSSAAFPPSCPNMDSKGVFVYRTLEDLDSIIEYAKGVKTAAVVGGGLLGLEAAKAVLDLGLQVTIFERNPRLMGRQLDDDGALLLSAEIEKLNIKLSLGNAPVEIIPDSNAAVAGLKLEDGTFLEESMVVFAIGIRPRDDVARISGIDVHPRGGVQVNDLLETSADDVFAVGEIALHRGAIYGLVAPGYEMAEVVARNLTTHRNQLASKKKKFTGGDLSSKLKLLGIHVASFGNYFAGPDISQPLVYNDPFGGVYKKYVFSKDGKHLLGGMMVGDTTDYAKLHALSKSKRPLPMPPGELIVGIKGGAVEGADSLPDEAQVCSCNNVTKGTIRKIIREKKLTSVGEVKSCSKAGTGCGGCVPQVTEIFEAEMKAMGVAVKNYVCHHFEYSRTELFEIVKIKKLKTFAEIMQAAGKTDNAIGCEVCKPAMASILASLYNDHVLDHTALQDTNDRFLANIQRGGTYSVVPRVPAGEITPEKLVAIGKIAKEYGLYTKITGGQRIDMFGARKQDLPDIWEKLVRSGFETGQAYGKSIRTSCVGSTWCRYGIGDSVGFAVKIENRYKGLRSPHKLKGGVSGCVRECAEAQSKDFGLIATDKGYNLYVCGNGGAKPKHAVLLATDISEELCIRYLDRFLMYYISTADKLTRTARWLEKMEGGIEHLKRVVIEDRLGIAAELETQMEYLVSTYQCEWAAVVNDPVRREKFRQFVNSDERQEEIEYITERGQQRPTNWPKDSLPSPPQSPTFSSINERSWVPVGPAHLFPKDSGETFKYGECQIAIFHSATDKWYATQNMCPHKRAFVLSQGLLGDQGDGTPYVSCGMHKKNFSLTSGKCLVPGEEEKYSLMTFDVKVGDDGLVYALMPSVEALNSVLSTKKLMITKSSTAKKSIELEGVNNELDSEMDGVDVVTSGCGGGSGCGDKKLEW
ncbi:hypothetical protein BC936DRAFT_136960 [Jimgerdemannia flammicorona]|uniref:Nitrite reductase [NAD(P)H] n=2 Tax=Jimgerdemannia flammicorona TaxID=994334 RepID=A0A433QRK1_9FUNG|nr:hypothetical protein BC936DRAFT_136960 [Jimgerdemannia flammicorona]RUS32424.1 hypothetical protein BC938DRAFT_475411 [Jimgerdemannia flammicorona]